MIDYYENITDHQVVPDLTPGFLGPLLPRSIPETGEKWEDIQKDIAEKIIPGITHWLVIGLLVETCPLLYS